MQPTKEQIIEAFDSLIAAAFASHGNHEYHAKLERHAQLLRVAVRSHLETLEPKEKEDVPPQEQ